MEFRFLKVPAAGKELGTLHLTILPLEGREVCSPAPEIFAGALGSPAIGPSFAIPVWYCGRLSGGAEAAMAIP